MGSVRMYDPRSGAASAQIVKAVYTSHQGWVSSVSWCRGHQHYFVSGSHDNQVKFWDCRSFKTPLYDLTGPTRPTSLVEELTIVSKFSNLKFPNPTHHGV